MHDSLVSILIPNFNKEAYIAETLDSILSQIYENWECIIVDDHSTDSSWEILKEYALKDSRIKIYKRPEHLANGGNSCRNYAFNFSAGKYVVWFDSDDLMKYSLIQNRIREIESKNVEFVIGSGLRFNTLVGDMDMVFSPVIEYPSFEQSFINLNPAWLTPSCLFSKDFLIKNKIQWNEEIKGFQDIEFNLNVLKKSKAFLILNEVDWYWRQTVNNVGSKLAHSNLFSSHSVFLKSIMKNSSLENKGLVESTFWKLILLCEFRFGFFLLKTIIISSWKNGVISNCSFIFCLKLLIKKYVSMIIYPNRKFSFRNDFNTWSKGRFEGNIFFHGISIKSYSESFRELGKDGVIKVFN
jgi:glycosyltransferase involved in cell wall biosynthesis